MARRKPSWHEAPPPEGSWRSLFKWGAPDRFKHPNARLVELMAQRFGMTEADFQPRDLGLDPVVLEAPSRLPGPVREALEAALGPGGLALDVPSRLGVAHGATALDLLRLRARRVDHLPDAVAWPRDAADVRRILAICQEAGIPVIPFGAGSSVTLGLEAVSGGVTLDLSRHMDKVLRLSEEDLTVTVQPGILGPALEDLLNHAPERLGARGRYTCGHFPQSFERSTVGGWVATRGAGQSSTHYGKIEDLVQGLELVAPAGTIRTPGFPAAALGPDLEGLLVGSEGAYGVLTEVTLRIFRHLPGSTRRYSHLFPDWDGAVDAVREVLQGRFGLPGVFRLSDPEETDVALRLYGVSNPVAEGLMAMAGLRPGRRCLLLGTAEGEDGFARHVAARVGEVARRHGALPASGLVTRAWEHGRFKDPYLRDDLLDVGVVIDTLECAVPWSRLRSVHEGVRAVCHARPDTFVLSHLSHGYAQGGNLYFIFIARMRDLEEYQEYQAGILDAFVRLGASLSHHHGIGKMVAPWLEAQVGRPALDLLRALKRHLDPANVMNPGGTLALDLPDGARRGPVGP